MIRITRLPPFANLALIAIAVALILTIILSWFVSNQLLSPENAHPGIPVTVVDSTGRSVILKDSAFAKAPGIWALKWDAGSAEVGPASLSQNQVDRTLAGLRPPPGGARLLAQTWFTDPLQAYGMKFSNVAIATPLGAASAWDIPAETPTDRWIISVHMRGGQRGEILLMLPQFHRNGMRVLAISYRNDADAPKSRDELYHLGASEWQDLESAVSYAQAHGARRIVLYGWSMGGEIITQFLDQSKSATSITAIVLDSPVTNWIRALRYQLSQKHLPSFLANTASLISSWRIQFPLERLDLIQNPPRVRPPMLIIHGAGDSTISVQDSRAVVAKANEINWPVQYLEIPEAEHTATWNAQPQRYEATFMSFLSRLGFESSSSVSSGAVPEPHEKQGK